MHFNSVMDVYIYSLYSSQVFLCFSEAILKDSYDVCFSIVGMYMACWFTKSDELVTKVDSELLFYADFREAPVKHFLFLLRFNTFENLRIAQLVSKSTEYVRQASSLTMLKSQFKTVLLSFEYDNWKYFICTPCF